MTAHDRNRWLLSGVLWLGLAASVLADAGSGTRESAAQTAPTAGSGATRVAAGSGSPAGNEGSSDTGAESGAARADESSEAPDATPGARPSQDADDDMVFDPAQPDFTVINLPSALRLPKHRLAFRLTHRFSRDLGDGDFGDLLADFFGFDSAAQIGLELRFGLMKGWQAGVYRASDRTIQLFTQYGVLRQGDDMPLGVDAWVTVEGTNNFAGNDPNQPTGRGQRSPTIGAVVSHRFGRTAAVYAMPAWIGNTNPLPDDQVDDDNTFVLGLGGRLRVRPAIYLVAEVVPRLGGYDPGTTLASFGVETRVGGHAFQLNFSNGLGTTMAQIARGGLEDNRWFIGFNISRKFY